MRTICAVAAVTAIGMGGTPAVGLTTGNDLLPICSTADFASQAACSIYVRGMMEGLRLGGMAAVVKLAPGLSDEAVMRATFKSLGFCLPEKATNQQLVDLLVGHLRSHPEDRHEEASYLMLSILSKTFPCGR